MSTDTDLEVMESELRKNIETLIRRGGNCAGLPTRVCHCLCNMHCPDDVSEGWGKSDTLYKSAVNWYSRQYGKEDLVALLI